jgi:hypothetical protein
MDAEIAALEARRDKTRAIKQGMMQQLLTGRVRLVEPADDGACGMLNTFARFLLVSTSLAPILGP